MAALRAEGWLERSRLAHDRAIEVLDEAVRMARRAPPAAAVARGAGDTGRGPPRAGSASPPPNGTSPRAARFLGDGGDVDVELEHQQAALHLNTGGWSRPATAYRRILGDVGTSAEMRTKAANNLGIIEVQCGRIESGLALFELATAEARHVGPGPRRVHRRGPGLGDGAGRAADRGPRAVRRGGGDVGQAEMPLGELYSEYAEALIDLRLIPEALAEARRAVVMLERRGVALMAAEALLRAARLALLGGDPVTAATEPDVARTLQDQGGRAGPRRPGHRGGRPAGRRARPVRPSWRRFGGPRGRSNGRAWSPTLSMPT